MKPTTRLAIIGVLLASCGTTQLGSRYIKSVTLDDITQPIELEVTAADYPPLAGARLKLRKNTLLQPSRLTVEVGTSDLTDIGAALSPVVIWGPAALALTKTARVTLPVTQRVAAEVLLEGETQTMVIREVTLDADTNTISFDAPVLGAFQVRAATSAADAGKPTTASDAGNPATPCSAGGVCSNGSACMNGLCR